MPPPARSRFDNTLTMNISYSGSKTLPNGGYLRSNALAAGGHLWRILYYPNGRLAGTSDSISLYLQLDAAVSIDDLHVEARFKLHEMGGGATHFVSSKVAGPIGSQPPNVLGFERFVSREDLEKSDLIVKHDAFRIRCDFTVFPKGGKPTVGVNTPPASGRPNPTPTAARAGSQPSVQQAAAPAGARTPPPVPPAVRALRSMSGLPADLGRLLETKEAADVDFEVGGKVFAAHKLVLAARSPVFMADFFGPAKEKATSYIRICDMNPDAFEALLHYMYTDTLPAAVTNAREEAAVLAQDLLVAADRYDLKDLKSLIENKLCRNSAIGVSTVLPMLALAENHRCRKLKKKCLEFIASGRNTRAVMANGDVEHLARSCPSVVKEVLTKIVDAREATPRSPLMVSVHVSFYFYALAFILPLGLWALLFVISFL